jgi:hypothetical protein
VNKLKKQVKVQPSQDNRRNIVKKLEKGETAPKIASQYQKKSIHHKKEEKISMDEKVEYARSAYLNTRRPHIKSETGYKTDDKKNSRVNTNDQQFIKSSKTTPTKRRSKPPRLLTMLLILTLMLLMFLICHIMILMLLMFL